MIDTEMGQVAFETSVFVNCPFDKKYLPLLRPLLFTVIHLGYTPRIASERFDSLESRIDKIIRLISESKHSIHDLSRLKAEKAGDFSRMNMPFELGVDFGSRLYGAPPLDSKRCLILEATRYNFMKALSDLSGVDIKSHAGKPIEVVRAVRDWFVEAKGLRDVGSPTRIWDQFNIFMSDIYDARRDEGFTYPDIYMMPVPEFMNYIRKWMIDRRNEEP